MKSWWVAAFALAGGLLGGGLLFLLASPPRGDSIQLIPPPSPEPVLVHVTGAVTAPGVYPLSPGSRVQDAITAAGGLLPEAEAEALNLVELVQDGQKIWVPLKVTQPNPVPNQPQSAPGEKFSEIPKTNPVQRVNINTADQAELESLPGIGPVLAQRILAYRAEHGLFTTIQQLDDVPGIGPAKFAEIRDLVFIAGEQ